MKTSILLSLCLACLFLGCAGTVQPVQEAGIAEMLDILEPEARVISLSSKKTLQDICSSGGNPFRQTAIVTELDERDIKYELEFIDIYLPFARNIVVDIPGTSDEVVYITAHYDKIDSAPWSALAGQLTAGFTDMVTTHVCLSDGALDNGVSCAVLVELADYFTKHKPHYSLRIVFFGGEEVGLRGSKCHVAGLSWEEWEKVKLCINMDGAGGGEDIMYIKSDLTASMENSLNKSMYETGLYTVAKHYEFSMIPILMSSDHASFQGSNLITTLLGGCLFHGYGAFLPKADWLSLYKSSKPTLFLSSNSIKDPLMSIIGNIFMLPIGSLHGVGDSASKVNPVHMYKTFYAVRNFVKLYREDASEEIVSKPNHELITE